MVLVSCFPHSGLLYQSFVHVSSDTAGARGYGTIFDNEWFMGEWSSTQQPLSIMYKELFPVVVASHLWDHCWTTKRMEKLPQNAHDNMAVVSMLHSGTSKDPNMMVLLRHLSLIAARHSFAFTASHRAGIDNSVADALSHFDFQHFNRLAPQAVPQATPILPSLLVLLPMI